MIVLDASVAVEYLLQSHLGIRVTQRLEDPTDVIHIPHLLAVEVSQVIRRLVTTTRLTSDRAREAVSDMADLAAIRHPHEPLLPRIWELRDNITAYDATYIALAEMLDAPLLTSDQRLASAPGHQASIEVIGSSH